jgi:hypothetical protein
MARTRPTNIIIVEHSRNYFTRIKIIYSTRAKDTINISINYAYFTYANK